MWPRYVLKAFEAIGPLGAVEESLWYGPWNVLLGHLFPVEEDFIVVPQFKRPPQRSSIDFGVVFLVSYNSHPVFFVEIKPASNLEKASAREDADDQMRHRFKKLFDDVEMETLHGLSAIGTQVCVYRYTRKDGRISPNKIPSDPNVCVDTAPITRWDLNFLSEEGQDRLRSLAEEVRKMCHAVCP